MSLFLKKYSAYLVLIFALLLTGTAWFFAQRSVHANELMRFNENSLVIEDAITFRMQTYINVLRQTRSFFMASDHVSPHEFRIYINSIQIQREYPGIQGIGFAQRLDPKTVAGFTASMHKSGVTDFEVWPWGTRQYYFPVTYLEPRDWRNKRALGYDMFSEPERREAMERAWTTGTPAATTPLFLVQETEINPQKGFLIYVPMFKVGTNPQTPAERRKNLIGFIYAPFRAEDLFRQAFAPTHYRHPGLGVEIYSSDHLSPENLLFNHNSSYMAYDPQYEPEFVRIKKVNIAGQTWSIATTSIPHSPLTSAHLIPLIIALLGTGTSFVLFRVLWINNRQAENLSKNERQLHIVIDSIPALVTYVDRRKRFKFINKRYGTWFNVSPVKISDKSVKEVLGDDNYTALEPYLDKALSGIPASFEDEVSLPNGEKKFIYGSYIPDIGPHGRTKGVITLITDITERKRADREKTFLVEVTTLLNSSLEYELNLVSFAERLVPYLADWCTIDLSGENGKALRVAAAHKDFQKHDLINLLLSESQEKEPILDGISDVIVSGIPLFYSVIDASSLSKHAGSSEHLEFLQKLGVSSVMILPLKARGRSLGALSLFRSTPGEHYQINDFNFALELAGRTALAVDNARLFLNARNASQAKDEFLATLSHELRTPMNVILGWIEILKNEPFDQQTFEQAIATLERNAKTQTGLINDLLDISRIVSGKIRLDVRPSDLNSVIVAAVDSLRPAAKAKGIALDIEVSPLIPTLTIDPERIQQVLWNLLSNSIKFTPPGGQVSATARIVADYVEVSIRDTGQGMDMTFLPHVFERFRQEEATTIRTHGGLGIGLAIVRYLTELHGGTINAYSEGKGKGSTFTIKLPLSYSPKESFPKRAGNTGTGGPTETKPGNGPSLNGVNILLVDDSPDVRNLLTRVLSRQGASVMTASCAEEALEKLESVRPDVLVSDIGMPTIDGYALIKKIRAMEKAQGLPAVPAAALTAYAQAEDAAKALDAGFQVHVAKPVRSEDLVQAIAQLTPRVAHIES